MSRTLWLIVCCALVLLLKPGVGLAQDEAGTQSRVLGPKIARLAERLAGERRVRVVTPWGPFELLDPRLEGADAIGYRRAWLYGLYDPPQGFPTPLPLATVSALQLRRSARDTGALMGGAALGAMGMLAGLTSMRSCTTAGTLIAGCGFTAADVARTTVLSAALGAAVGALYGAQFKRWKTVYRARYPVQPPGIGTRSFTAPK